MSQIIPGGLWYKNHCLKITPQKKVGSLRYRYPNEDWVEIEADDYTIEDGTNGWKVYEYDVLVYFDSLITQLDRPGGEYVFQSHVIPTGGTFTGFYFPEEYTFGGEHLKICVDYTPLPGLTKEKICREIYGSAFGFIPGAQTVTKIDKGRYVLKKCAFTCFVDGKTVFSRTSDNCPEVEVLDDRLRQDEVKVEVRTSPLGQIWISNTAFSRNGGLLGDLPEECIHVYNMIPYLPIGASPGFGSTGTGAQILAFVCEHCSDKGKNRPTVERLGDDCKESCPNGTCAIGCDSSVCCADPGTGKVMQEIPLSEYRGVTPE